MHGTAATGETTSRDRRTRGVRCAHPGGRRRAEAADDEEEAAARIGSWRRWCSHGSRGEMTRTRDSPRDGDVDGGGGEV